MRDKAQLNRMTRAVAEDIAARAFLFIAEDGRRLSRFLADTGLDPDYLRARIHSAETLSAALGHLMADEASLLAFAANAGLRPEDVARAEAVLGGVATWESS